MLSTVVRRALCGGESVGQILCAIFYDPVLGPSFFFMCVYIELTGRLASCYLQGKGSDDQLI